MTTAKLRRQIAFDAARLMYTRQESEYYRAKLKAARRICRGWVKPGDLPSNAEIRDQIQMLSRTFEGDARFDNLRQMRIEALRLMRVLRLFRPRLIGSVLTGHIRQGSDIDIHVFADTVDPIVAVLESEGMRFDVQRKRVRKYGEERIFTHVHVIDRFPFEITVYPSNQAHNVFRSSITGKAMERASIAELEKLLEEHYPGIDLQEELAQSENRLDRFQLYEALLLPLESVKQDPRYHPEGDALYHSLQVFDLARNQMPYDEEFLLAALLHDIGKAIDPDDHVTAGLEALADLVEPRTAWLIANHMEAQRILDRSIGMRAARRLRQNENYDDLMLLVRCDREGRRSGVNVPDLDEALDYVRELSRMCEGT